MQRLFVIIDEYDNFANTNLSTSGRGDYQAITHGEGFFRAFFNVLKEGTSGSGAPIGRLFLTGVSPLTLDGVTIGYNIGENVSLDAAFNQILGFTGNDVREMLDYYQRAGLIKDDLEFLMEIIDEWYGSYLFSKYADSNERLYNSDMVLYFLKEYFKTRAVPEDLIDRDVRIDYEKLRHLIFILFWLDFGLFTIRSPAPMKKGGAPAKKERCAGGKSFCISESSICTGEK